MTSHEEKSLKFLRDISNQLDRHDYKDIKPWLIDYIKTMPIAMLIDDHFPRFNNKGFYRNPKELYRASENETRSPKASMALPWKNVGRLSHVPLDQQYLVKDYGRANLPGEARFYCSNYYPTACIECLTNGFVRNQNENKAVTMSVWTVNAPLVLAQMVFSEKKLNEIKHLNPELYEDRIQFTRNWYTYTLEQLNKDTNRPCSIDFAKEVLEFFSDEFGKIDIRTGRDYILSNFYCDYIFNQNFSDDPKTIDGIIYPSVKYSYQEFNIVLHPRAMSKISFSRASQIWVTYNGQSNQVQFNPLETAYSDMQGNIAWNLFNC